MGNQKWPRDPDPDNPVGRISFDALLRALAAMAAEVRTPAGAASSERMTRILMGPAQRIARAALESHLGRNAVGCDDIEAVATEGLKELHRFLVTRKRDVPVMRALTILTRRTARCYIRERCGCPDAPEDN